MSRLTELRESMAARHLQESRLAEGDRRRSLGVHALACLVWAAIGISGILWSAHTTSYTWGRIAFLSGVIVGNAGIIFTLLSAWRAGERRGDW